MNDLKKIAAEMRNTMVIDQHTLERYADALDALAAQAGEPVAWLIEVDGSMVPTTFKGAVEAAESDGRRVMPLYATPPPATPAGWPLDQECRYHGCQVTGAKQTVAAAHVSMAEFEKALDAYGSAEYSDGEHDMTHSATEEKRAEVLRLASAGVGLRSHWEPGDDNSELVTIRRGEINAIKNMPANTPAGGKSRIDDETLRAALELAEEETESSYTPERRKRLQDLADKLRAGIEDQASAVVVPSVSGEELQIAQTRISELEGIFRQMLRWEQRLKDSPVSLLSRYSQLAKDALGITAKL